MGTKKPAISISAKKTSRPPIVAVLGHVDHGKTALLSKIKEVDLAKKEHGGISQHIGAYSAKFEIRPITPAGRNSKFEITFIDTPGHVAFSQMRSRGAKVADLAVLVVAADEGVKPQTLESLKHLRQSKTPFLVAINKIDLANVRLDWVKGNLAENEVLVEGYGGDIVAVPISAKTGEGVPQLLEMVNLLAQMHGLEGDAQGPLKGVVIESRLDSRRGPLVTVLLRSGQISQGDQIWVEAETAKIKALIDENGQRLEKISAGQAAQILGFSQVPVVGVPVTNQPMAVKPKVKAETEAETEGEDKLRIILKTDVAGTLEAILGSLPEEVAVMQSGTGAINESDIMYAQVVGAWVIGFNVKLSVKVKKLAVMEAVTVNTYQIIYDLLEDIEKKVLKIMEPTIDEQILGKAEVVAEFTIKDERIAGCRVTEGRINKKDQLHLQRVQKPVADCRIKSLKSGKADVKEVKAGEEFGAVLNPQVDFKIGDVLVSYQLPPKVDEKQPSV